MEFINKYEKIMQTNYENYIQDVKNKHITALFCLNIYKEIVKKLQPPTYAIEGSFPYLKISSRVDTYNETTVVYIQCDGSDIYVEQRGVEYKISINDEFVDRVEEIIRLFKTSRNTDNNRQVENLPYQSQSF